jgi:predicted transcriptional regulator of viral defense system
MYEAEIIEKFSKVPVFSLADVSQIVKNRNYAKVVVSRMVKNRKIKKVKKGFYTLHEDPFLVSTFLVKPSYVSSVSALYFHRKITQIPNEIFCFTNKLPRKIFFLTTINFFHTDLFFGFEIEKYEGFDVPVATVEKAIIDSVGKFPLSLIEEAFEGINLKRMLEYLKKIKRPSVVKRVGFLLEKNGYRVYSELKDCIKDNYIPLDPLLKTKRRKERKWKVLI